MENIEFLKGRLAEHKRCYELAIDADDDQEMRRQAQEMRNIKEQIKNFGGEV